MSGTKPAMSMTEDRKELFVSLNTVSEKGRLKASPAMAEMAVLATSRMNVRVHNVFFIILFPLYDGMKNTPSARRYRIICRVGFNF